jgi:hypothetical protein
MATQRSAGTSPQIEACIDRTSGVVAPSSAVPAGGAVEPWWNVHQAAQHAECGPKQIYKAVRNRRLRAVQLGQRGDLRFWRQWVDDWLESLALALE